MKKRVLWIDDTEDSMMDPLATTVIINRNYELTISPDASDAQRLLCSEEYDAIIVDLRIPPGDDKEWISLFLKFRRGKLAGELGLELISSFVNPEKSLIKQKVIPAWISPHKFGIFTVISKSDIENEVNRLGVRVYFQKTAHCPRDLIIKITEAISDNN